MHWNRFFHLGDIELTVALAAAMSAWLIAARAWRIALWWGLLFLLGVGLVAASKVAFMAWGMTVPGADFKAISGHATGVTAVFTTLFYLLLQRHPARARIGAFAGLVLGALMVVLLVVRDQHSAAEALIGWVIGAAASLAAIRLGGPMPQGGVRPQGLLCAMLVFACAAWTMQAVPHRYLLSRTALFISGNAAPFSWCVDGQHQP